MQSPLRAQLGELLAEGRTAAARELSAAALARNPLDLRARLLHAQVLAASGDARDAASLVDETPMPPAADADAWLLRAGCEQALARIPQALACYERALSVAPQRFRARFEYADLLDAAGQPETAVPQFFRAIFDAQQQGRWLDRASTPADLHERVPAAMDRVDAHRHALFESTLQPHLQAHGAPAMARVRRALAVYLGLAPAPPRPPGQLAKFFWMPDLPATPYFDAGLLPWYAPLEAAYPAIREECLRALDAPRALEPFLGEAAPGEYLAGDGTHAPRWDAYFFSRHGRTHAAHLDACPATAAALSQVPLARIAEHAPEVLFSVLAPGSHITPHTGVTNTRVVTHLPLVIPDGDCRLVVAGQAHAWQEGRCVTFDDTFVHEAWNRSAERRVVLILDTWNPYLQPEECAALKDLVEGIGAFNRGAGIG